MSDGAMELDFFLAPHLTVKQLHNSGLYNIFRPFFDNIDQHLRNDRIYVGIQVLMDLLL